MQIHNILVTEQNVNVIKRECTKHMSSTTYQVYYMQRYRNITVHKMKTSQDASILIRLSYETSNVTKRLCYKPSIVKYMRHTEKCTPPINGPHPPVEPGICKSWFAVGAGLAVDFALPLHGPLQADCLAEIEWTTGHSNKPHLFFVSDEDG
jgi:hypothetical protein